MTIVVEISDDAHALVTNKKLEIRKKYSRGVHMSDIATAAIFAGMDKVEERLGLKVQIKEEK